MKGWSDQHLKTCTCKKCDRKSNHVPDHPVLNAKAEQASQFHNEIVYDGNSPYIFHIDGTTNVLTVNPEAKKSPDASVQVDGNTVWITGVWTLNGSWIAGGSITWGSTWAAGPAEPPTVELLESSNPFARALDAWQTGKAGWTKGVLFRRDPQPEGVST